MEIETTMNKKETQIYALEKSIEHWERLANGTYEPKEEPTATWCDCCIEYGKDCKNCPIMEFTGKIDCINTPFYKAAKTWRLIYQQGGARTPERINEMNAEVDFLKTVLNKLKK